MSPEEFHALRLSGMPTIGVADVPGADRTLMVGVRGGEVSHVYVQGGLLHLLVYSREEPGRVLTHDASEEFSAGLLLGDCLVFPELVDSEFARVMLDRAPVAFLRQLFVFAAGRYWETLGRAFHASVLDEVGGLTPSDPL